MDDLERELRDLAGWLETPDPPDMTARVRTRLAAAPAGRRHWRLWRRWRRWRHYLAAAIVALLVAVLPPGRAAVADAVTGLLRFAGVRVTSSPAPALPPGTPSPLPAQRPASLDEARQNVRFPIRLPAALGPPERLLLADPDDTGGYRVASLLYRAGAVRLDAFDGQLDPAFAKQVGGPEVEWVEINGAPAVWVAGPHQLTYVDRTGMTRAETARLAGSTLIWQVGDVTYRLEGELTKDDAVAIARTLRP
ncbi:hypothetical protein [Plantactinospora sp. GCM10030261]|uniref:hypothetical protein n=1 Tax=Plantactinospora sp. GCM10030261 TaxID=3273420 RepID=UPI0036071E1F